MAEIFSNGLSKETLKKLGIGFETAAEEEKYSAEWRAFREKEKVRLAAQTPEERETHKVKMEEWQKKWDYMGTPEGKRDFVAFMVRQAKKDGIIPPTRNHLWINMPTGWAEYREESSQNAEKKSSFTVTFGTPTKEQWDEYYPALQKELKEWRLAQKAREDGRDGRIDPKTGEPLLPGERPLHMNASYHITGKTRPRVFVCPGSNTKPLQTDGEEERESPENERLIKRLREAGFVEVAPTGWDKQFFTFCERLRQMSPYELARDWQEYQREARERMGLSEKTIGERFGEMLFDIFDLLILLLRGSPVEDMEESKKQKVRTV